MFFKHFANKNQLPGLCVSGTLVENGLSLFHLQTKSGFNKNVLADTQFFSRINRKSIKRFADYAERFHLITPLTYFLPWCLSINKKIRKPPIFQCFQGVQRETLVWNGLNIPTYLSTGSTKCIPFCSVAAGIGKASSLVNGRNK